MRLWVRRDDIETAILRYLRVGERDTISIRREVEEQCRSAVFTPSFGRVSTILWDLERDGLIASRDGETVAERGWRPRRYYRLTGAGMEWGAR